MDALFLLLAELTASFYRIGTQYGAPVAIEAPSLAAPPVVAGTLLAPLAADTPDGNLARGLAALADGRIGLSTVYFDRALAQRPEWADALIARSISLLMHDDLEAAIRDVDRVIAMDAARADAHVVRAWINLVTIIDDRNLLATALAAANDDIAQALTLEPDRADALALQAQIHLWEGITKLDREPAAGTEAVMQAMAELASLQHRNPGLAGDIYLA